VKDVNKLKIIGLLGGMSWESTQSYYSLLNEGVKKRLGKLNSAKIVMYSVNFEEIEILQRENRWKEAGNILAKNAKSLELAGADFILICTNTMHKVIDIIQEKINIPIIHIATATAKEMKNQNAKKAILLGTRFTMQEDFIKSLIQSYGIEIVTPSDMQIKQIDNIIFNELVLGVINPKSKNIYKDIIKKLYEENKDIDSIILGCTEIGLLINQEDTKLKTFDTTVLHVKEALDIALL
jgi:aspartate racemase